MKGGTDETRIDSGGSAGEMEVGFAEAVRYRKKYGNLDVPQHYVTPSGFALGMWICAQRRKRREHRLFGYQAYLLDQIDMIWNPVKTWDQSFAIVRSYVNAHGGSWDVPYSAVVDGLQIQDWIRKCQIRWAQGRLTDEHAMLLINAGMPL